MNMHSDGCDQNGADLQRAAEGKREKMSEWGYRFAWAGIALCLSAISLIGVVRGQGIFVVAGLWWLGFLAACVGFVFAAPARAKRKSIVIIMIVTGLIFL